MTGSHHSSSHLGPPAPRQCWEDRCWRWSALLRDCKWRDFTISSAPNLLEVLTLFVTPCLWFQANPWNLLDQSEWRSPSQANVFPSLSEDSSYCERISVWCRGLPLYGQESARFGAPHHACHGQRCVCGEMPTIALIHHVVPQPRAFLLSHHSLSIS